VTALDPLDAMLADLAASRDARARRTCTVCDAGVAEHVQRLRQQGDSYEGIARRLRTFMGISISSSTIRLHCIHCRDS